MELGASHFNGLNPISTKETISYSSPLEITCGVPQSSVLGPLLFLLYINDIYRSSEILKFHLFADDTSIFYSAKDSQKMEDSINHELKSLAIWLNANILTLNVSKSSFVVFHPPRKKVTPIKLIINNSHIPEKIHAKYLGVFIDKHLTWFHHIHQINTKLSRALGILSKLRHNLPLYLLKTVYHAFFKPHIDYCINIWTCTSTTILEPIAISMKKAIRIMTFNRYDAHTQPLFHNLNLLNFEQTINLNLGNLMWDIHQAQLPSCLLTALNTDIISKFQRKRKTTEKYKPLCRTKYKLHFLTTTGTTLWSSLPDIITQSKSKNIFKNRYKKYLLNLKQ